MREKVNEKYIEKIPSKDGIKKQDLFSMHEK